MQDGQDLEARHPGLLQVGADPPAKLAGAIAVRSTYQRSRDAPQLKPVPNAASKHRSPRLIRPSWRVSCRRMGTEAAEVLPYLWMFTGSLEAGMLRLSAMESRIRTLAW